MRTKHSVETRTVCKADGAPALRKLRAAVGMSQAEFARHLGISLPLCQKMEAGEKPIAAVVRERVREIYGGVLEKRRVTDVSGSVYRPEFFDRVRGISDSKIFFENVLQGAKQDLERLLRAARDRRRLNAFLPRLHDFCDRAADELGLRELLEAADQAGTVTAGEIRAWERARPLRARKERLLSQLQKLQLRAAGKATEASTRQIAKLEKSVVEMDDRIAETCRKVQVRGRRKTIYRQLGGQFVLISPRVPDSKRYSLGIESRQRGGWWHDYLRELRSVAETPADAPGE